MLEAAFQVLKHHRLTHGRHPHTISHIYDLKEADADKITPATEKHLLSAYLILLFSRQHALLLKSHDTFSSEEAAYMHTFWQHVRRRKQHRYDAE